MNFEDFMLPGPFELERERKEELLSRRLWELTDLHRERCSDYRCMLQVLGIREGLHSGRIADVPFIPVRLFKERDLMSVPGEELVKTITSSGTTGQRVSRIHLDRETAANQQRAMVRIVGDFVGTGRMPMIIIDSPAVLRNMSEFSARAAGVLGFSIFGTGKIYALDQEMRLDLEALKTFLEKHRGRRILLFGFTFMIWKHFVAELLQLREQGITLDLSGGILIHGGGWKKLAQEAVTPEEFRGRLKDLCRLEHVHDYYGMAEQTGCVCMECECHHLHTSIFSDVIVRRPLDFGECSPGEPGILQVVSSIPQSYPGHSLLTEDEGILLGEDDCPCGRKGRYFRVTGRIARAELRGCSDTYAESIGKS